MKYSYLILLFSGMISCASPEARRPISYTKTQTLASATEQLKKINKIEEAKVLAYIKNDSLHTYITSSNGYWFQYLLKNETQGSALKKGTIATISYEIYDLNDQVIYSKEELGVKEYTIDKEDFIPALQSGIKMMRVGEIIKFIIPSHHAFGVVGDDHRIGINQSIISIVTLINIKEDLKNEE
ncbi:MAG: gliding motility-associated peptidyl-prolyl isomerase GldI [Flavobacteriaceae bacterium]|nr:gliding motility-associated peptidyl-prolyl isomerase GldI [Flavobacteriaceae bacterium]